MQDNLHQMKIHSTDTFSRFAMQKLLWKHPTQREQEVKAKTINQLRDEESCEKFFKRNRGKFAAAQAKPRFREGKQRKEK